MQNRVFKFKNEFQTHSSMPYKTIHVVLVAIYKKEKTQGASVLREFIALGKRTLATGTHQ